MKQEYTEYWKAVGMALGLSEEAPDWEIVDKYAKEQITLPMLYYGLWEHDRLKLIPKALREEWKKLTCSTAIRETSRRADLERVLKAAAERDIKLICFKGDILARLYPEWKTRISGDSDLFVYERDKDRAIGLLEELGYQQDKEKSKSQVPVFLHPIRKHKLELHFSLWEDYEGKQIDMLNKMALTDEAELEAIMVGAVKGWTLSPTNHLIYQMFHIIKHFSVQGIGTKYMWDITYFLKAHIQEIDKDKFWRCMEELGYQEFCTHYFGLCERYLGLNVNIMLTSTECVDRKKQEKLLADMMAFSNKEKLDYKVITLMSPYLEGRETVAGGSLMRKLSLIFPMPDALQEEFSYAKRHRILLPIAWGHKWLRFMKNHINGKSAGAAQKLKEADNRLEMMQEMNLLK